MTRSPHLLLYLATILCCTGASAQSVTSEAEQIAHKSTTAPVAYVYVGNTVDQSIGLDNLYAFSAAADGKLTTLPGSPFSINPVVQIEGNGKFFFDVDYNTATSASETFDTFSPASNGVPKLVEKASAPSGYCFQFQFYLDSAVKNLYGLIYGPPDCSGEYFQVFDVNESTGKLQYKEMDYLGPVSETEVAQFGISFLGNDKYAYSPASLGVPDCKLLGFSRQSNGKLTELNLGNPGPDPRKSGHFYCPINTATDASDHLAVVLQEYASKSAYNHGEPYGPPVIAIYTAEGDGKLATTSTYENMPAIAGAGAISISPSGKFLAVTGGLANSVEIFHFNGASPLTKYKTLLTNEKMFQFSWDNSNHLYALGNNLAGEGVLYVFTVAEAGITEAAGSPYSVPNPFYLFVQPR